MDAIVNSLLEIELKNPDDFLKIKETLTRIGVASKKQQILYQSCHILHKQGRYYIVHFKELFLLDGKPSDFTDNDKARRNSIAILLQEWSLVKIVDDKSIREDVVPLNQLKILTFKDKENWELIQKYNLGNKGKVD